MNILLAFDSSPQSHAAASLLQRIQFPAGSKLFLLYVLETQRLSARHEGKAARQWQPALSAFRSNEEAEARKVLSRAAESCWNTKLKTTPLVREGVPGGAILSAIDQYHIDLVVLGTRGKTGLKRFLMGSVSEWVLAEAPCSVLIVRKKPEAKTKVTKGLNLIVANDGSLDSKCAAEFTRQLTFPRTSIMTLCHVIEEQYALRTELAARLGVTGKPDIAKLAAQMLKAREREGKKLLTATAASLKPGGRPIKQSLVYGHPADQLLTTAQQKNADIIIMGSRGITGLRRVFLGSVSNKVASYAPCSVLVVRKPRKSRRNSSRT